MKRWKTKDGKSLLPSEMETEHIENALAYLKRQGYVGPSTVKFYVSCPLPTGDVAEDLFYREFDSVLDAPVSKFVDLFEAELERRYLD